MSSLATSIVHATRKTGLALAWALAPSIAIWQPQRLAVSSTRRQPQLRMRDSDCCRQPRVYASQEPMIEGRQRRFCVNVMREAGATRERLDSAAPVYDPGVVVGSRLYRSDRSL